MSTCCPILELRQYTLHPHQRETLVELFDREFVETQEAAGVRIVGQFRDLDNPDRFVWVRGFHDMATRAEALATFYGGPVWAKHRDAANATMIDWDDVLLLRPFDERAGFPLPGVGVPVRRPATRPASLVTATVYPLDGAADAAAGFFTEQVEPVLTEAGAAPLARLLTEPSANTFPRLPVREGDQVVVRFARFAGPDDLDAHTDRLRRSTRWRRDVLPELSRRLSGAPQQLHLTPTARSLL